jgi:hypothetical protein
MHQPCAAKLRKSQSEAPQPTALRLRATRFEGDFTLSCPGTRARAHTNTDARHPLANAFVPHDRALILSSHGLEEELPGGTALAEVSGAASYSDAEGTGGR